MAKLNHYDQVNLEIAGNINEFLISVDKYIKKECSNEKFLTDFCWDLKPVTIKDVRKRKINKIIKNEKSN